MRREELGTHTHTASPPAPQAALKWHPDRHSTAEDDARLKAEANFKDVGA